MPAINLSMPLVRLIMSEPTLSSAPVSSHIHARQRSDNREQGPAPVDIEPTAQNTPAASADATAKQKRQRTRKTLFLLIPLALLGGGYLYATGGRVVSTDNAYIQADKVAVSTDVSGLVDAIEVKDNQAVSRGQVLFRLNAEPFQIALASATANLGTVRNQILNQQAAYSQALAEIDQAQSELPFFEQAFRRQEKLLAVNAVSRTTYDQARHDLDTTLKKIAVAKAQARAVLAQLGGRLDIPVEQQPTWLQAKALVDEAKRNLNNAVVRAPFDGIVTNVDALQVGTYLQPPQSGISLVASQALWVAAQPKETELTHVRPGQPVEIRVDSYPGVIWHGTVESISPASGSSFSLLPAQNTTGNWVKVVQRIPVRIRIDDQVGKPPLRHGMSVEAEIDTGRARNMAFGWFAHQDAGHE
ncbi:HlyD family secretion protein [Pseudomonas asiatica]|uniref:HlyD family secretion protein n=1 Tax=Pseudomonas asiatica TaxID=2219225 RepID=UPI002E7B0DFB|nr:HlyD family secretion protein [Pseudomonas asiatica]MEE1916317.1 HlyD family secretion protein [Pseudomonas asiatica]